MVNKWDIYVCELDPTKGSEQRGTRPVLVISNDAVNHSLPIATVIPFSSIKGGEKIYPTEVYIDSADSGMEKNSVVMLQQIRTVAQLRLYKMIGKINSEEIKKKINDALKDYFEI